MKQCSGAANFVLTSVFSVRFLPMPSFSCAFFISPKMQCSAVHLFFAVRYCNRHQHQQTKLRATVALYSLIAVDFPPMRERQLQLPL